MIRHFLMVVCLFLSANAFSQNFAVIYNGRNVLFSNPNWKEYYTNFAFSPNEGYIGLGVDSSGNIGSNTIFYYFPILRYNPEGGFECAFKRSPNLLGSLTLVKSNGENIFLTNAGDSLHIQTLAKLHDTWHFCDFPDGNYFEAEVTSLTKGTILGALDSLKIITLTFKDAQGNALAHDFNGKQLFISKNQGIAKAYDFWSFPADTSAFILQGVSNPAAGIQNITAKEIFDFNVGDEFHIDYASSDPTSSFPAIFDKEKRIVISKTISANEDTIRYTFQRYLIRDKFSWRTSTHDTTIPLL